MKVLLAGFNIDNETISALKAAQVEDCVLTPETIAAAYARISRSPKTVTELREEARKEVEKARASNRNIVFSMGHSSIAEHAVFNVDVLGVSRLLVEEIEKFRLCSFTEKSQRYVLLKGDYVIPEEIRIGGFAEEFQSVVEKQNAFYRELFEKFMQHLQRDRSLFAKNGHKFEGLAKEDARYILSLATETQLGMTINARNLELMLRRLGAHPLEEARAFSRALYEVTVPVAPSLIRYTEAKDYDTRTRCEMSDVTFQLLAESETLDLQEGSNAESPSVRLVHHTPGADVHLTAALLHSSSDRNWDTCLRVAYNLKPEERKRFFLTAFRYLQSYDAVLREFEHVDLLFELIISASCYAQLKRHRMATLTTQPYDPSLGVTIPERVYEVGLDRRFSEIIYETNELYYKIKGKISQAADYCLTNSHRRRVLFKVNARELYHIARLRMDSTAQWDIRRVVAQMVEEAQKIMPLTLLLACGKDRFSTQWEKIQDI
ncbi:MAG: FAD-dependent thymidylate synthase [Syntrophales bacterium]|nr:FAD-dependent thymidylate synthase [Syntrophales bacterium]